ncbi:DivIVA domain-containing protein [Ruania halotolerans]|uniref:DivIVA domain-containing protein n=1 Tax=Ruania halotolerans TaxID=2897773 RepID=UPI001E529B7D|nr:DivIVA domain-containing protein [Ruania halotolerans]UFU05193.1 DivIVA domain-containing protein [Ruania halotolerans]
MEGIFPTVKGWANGYDRDEVDDFFTRARAAYEGDGEPMGAEDVRGVAFDLLRGGYEPAAVDAALDRLEGAFVQRERADFISAHGQEAWMEQVAERATTLYPRLVRPAGERFAPPERGRGYAADAVDEVMEELVAYFDEGHTLSAADLRHITFPRAARSRAYAEGPVDAFLDRAVDVLLAVE